MNAFVSGTALSCVAAALFVIGALGVVLNRQHLIGMLFAVELMLLASVLNFVAFGALEGQVFAMIVLAVAAAETGLGLALFVVAYRLKRKIGVEDWSDLRG